MSMYPLERQRQNYEDAERLLRLATAAMREHEQLRTRSKPGAKEEAAGTVARQGIFVDAEGNPTVAHSRDADLVVRTLIDSMSDKLAEIQSMQAKDGILDTEVEQITGKGDQDAAVTLFYDRLSVIKAAFPSDQQSDMLSVGQMDKNIAARPRAEVDFSGEEAGGRYLDLYECHAQFVNLPGIDPEVYEYKDFLANFYAFGSLPEEVRSRPAYKVYLTKLLSYLLDFSDRVMPLKFSAEQIEDVKAKTLEKMRSSSGSVVDATKYDSAEALEKGESADALKEALKKLGLKCGGTPKQRAERLFKAAKATNDTANGAVGSSRALRGEVEVLEAQVKYVCEEVLSDHIQSTRTNVEKKMVLSYEELKAERLNEENPQGAASDDDDSNSEEEKTIHNPKDVPLGWDGKPIPYWLYKLHGLNHEFRCEVCGDVTYRGPRNFERHFSEARHTHNLKMLGVQYSRYFYMVTKIDDVLHLAEKYKSQSARQDRTADDEEFEDAEGNVFNRKTYEDLRRQGLL